MISDQILIENMFIWVWIYSALFMCSSGLNLCYAGVRIFPFRILFNLSDCIVNVVALIFPGGEWPGY